MREVQGDSDVCWEEGQAKDHSQDHTSAPTGMATLRTTHPHQQVWPYTLRTTHPHQQVWPHTLRTTHPHQQVWPYTLRTTHLHQQVWPYTLRTLHTHQQVWPHTLRTTHPHQQVWLYTLMRNNNYCQRESKLWRMPSYLVQQRARVMNRIVSILQSRQMCKQKFKQVHLLICHNVWTSCSWNRRKRRTDRNFSRMSRVAGPKNKPETKRGKRQLISGLHLFMSS